MSEERKLQAWEIKSLQEIKDQWYTSFYTLIFTPPGEIPQTRGAFTDGEQIIEMANHLRKEYGAELKIIVAGSRCGDVSAEDYEEWKQMREDGMECAEEEARYVAAGVCSQCGACSLKEADTKCRPSPLGDSGDYSCDGERLWEDQRNKEDEEPDEG